MHHTHMRGYAASKLQCPILCKTCHVGSRPWLHAELPEEIFVQITAQRAQGMRLASLHKLARKVELIRHDRINAGEQTPETTALHICC